MMTGDSPAQEFTATALAMNGFSAVFNGDSVVIELRVQSDNSSDENSRVIISAYPPGLCDDDVSPSFICDGIDDRVLSYDVRQGRLSMGCTRWFISEDVFVQAGHCGLWSNSMHIHFHKADCSADSKDQCFIKPGSYTGEYLDEERGTGVSACEIPSPPAPREPPDPAPDDCRATSSSRPLVVPRERPSSRRRSKTQKKIG